MTSPSRRTRRFLSWHQPALPQIASTILGDHVSGDLSKVLIVLPTRRAGRLLLRQLAMGASPRGMILHPPRMTTPGGVDAVLFPETPFATAFERRRAWARALSALDESRVQDLLGRVPDRDDFRSWMAVAEATLRLQTLLESVDASLTHWRDSAEGAEKRRAEAMLQAEVRYLEILSEVGRVDPFAHRRQMLAQDGIDFVGTIYLAGTVDLSRSVRNLLERCADRSAELHALVYGDEKQSDFFDALGILRSDLANDFVISLERESCSFAENPKDESRRVLSLLSDWSASTSADDIAICSLGKETTSLLLVEAGRIGVSLDWEEGRPATESAPIRLLEQAIRFRAGRSVEDFASLARHADVLAYLALGGPPGKTDRMLGVLDEYRVTTVAARLPEASKLDEGSELRSLAESIDGFITWNSNEMHSLGEWARRFSECLTKIYEPVVKSNDASTIEAHHRELPLAGQCLRSLAGTESIDPSPMSCSDAWEMLRETAGEHRIPERVGGDAVPLVGWLDLLWEPASHLVVAGMQEGATSPDPSHPFLSDRTATALRLPSREDRWTRDVYQMSAILALGRNVKFLASRSSSKGDPLLPSRLLLTGPLHERMDRMKSFFNATRMPISFRQAVSDPIRIKPPPVVIDSPITGMSVTAFRDYLACPYRFYLKHVRKLREIDDEVGELDGATYGSLVHDLLMKFGQGEVRHSSNAREIFDYLSTHLDMVAREKFTESLPAVQVQIEQLRRRFQSFAAWQASHVTDGWRIADVEIDVPRGSVNLLVDGDSFHIYGRIDRVDIHATRGELAIYDYKTGDGGMKPEKAHRNGDGEWTDLQLPLYRHLLTAHSDRAVREILKRGCPRLGYILISKSLDSIGEECAEWTPEELDDADETARSVIRGIRSGEFTPTRESVERYYPEYVRLCQDGMQRESEK